MLECVYRRSTKAYLRRLKIFSRGRSYREAIWSKKLLVPVLIERFAALGVGQFQAGQRVEIAKESRLLLHQRTAAVRRFVRSA
jgi:hypothetical protein